MASTCEPLCHFGDRLYFTTFPHPPPPPNALNSASSGESPQPRLKTTTGAPPTPEDDAPYFFFTFDSDLVYLSFFEDWGPLNLAMVYRSCIQIHDYLQDEQLASHRLVLYTSTDPRRKANAALLMALYVMIVQRKAPWDAFHPIAEMEFMPFRDAGRGKSDFNLSIQDCLWGLWKALQNGLCDLNDFSVEEYEYYEKVENGDWNWVTPNFIAFASPVDPGFIRRNAATSITAKAGSSRPPEIALQRKLPAPFLNCLDYFGKRNVKLVVRLNNPLYDKTVFEDQGIEHLELYFDDGTNPTDEIVRKFIQVSESVIEGGGAVAVHCKAGLGRTGTLIGAYLIYKHAFTANEAIAFMRIVRPGSVVGPQQQYMYLKQLDWSRWAAYDEMAKARPTTPGVGRPVTPPEMDKPLPPVPPVTPSRHATAGAAATASLAPPGQPRKTPTAKRVAVDPVDSDEEASLTGRRRPLTKHARTESAACVRETAPSRLARPATRAALGSPTRKAVPATALKAPPYKLGHVPSASTTEVSSGLPLRRGVRRAESPSPTPSRLPQLVPAKRGTALTPLPGGPQVKGRKRIDKADAWIASASPKQERSKLGRPLLRGMRRRRSSFSAADVVA
ncbi:phospho protein phosphatase [Calocera viscosa TUFC12733]|uniref:protein-tyrosine-phosphatase n=1 Tax=Calocera viscosa (strain TUFC12733) TaxID=1330018 RepID=A0A167KS36_CALVF|nr:phospho protein phosphatase [Calocera viscosa TUFC12733]